MTLSRQHWDVLIVGAGPAGSSAAAAAASRGVKTLVLDSANPPRYKTCGGGLIGVSNGLAADLGDVPILEQISEVTFSFKGKFTRTRRSRSPIMGMVNRAEFDLTLLDHATRLGASFEPRVRVRSLEKVADQYIVRTNNLDYRASVVIGADGSESRVAREVGVQSAIVDLGLEVELAAGVQAKEWKNRIHLDWGPLPGSYGWVFPKGDVLTVGVIAAKGQQAATREYLSKFIHDLKLHQLEVLRSSGHQTKCRREDSPVSRDKVLVCGDAAGLLEPWTREGISFAMRSGGAAGTRSAQLSGARTQAEIAAVEDGYRRDLSPLFREMRAGLLSRRAFENHPIVFHSLLGYTPFGWKYFERIASGDTTLARAVTHASARIPLKILAHDRA